MCGCETRVLQALSNSGLVAKLRGKLPKDALESPAVPTKTPTGLLKEISAMNLGVIAESLLRGQITILPDIISAKTRESKQTKKFLEAVEELKGEINRIADGEKQYYEKPITQTGCDIVGHPDIITTNHIFEIKTTSRLKTNWKSFLLQAFCYAALAPRTKFLHIVLPLQGHIWTYDLSNWVKRNEFLTVLKGFRGVDPNNIQQGLQAAADLGVGMHIGKKTTLAASVRGLPNVRPYQLFLSMKSTPFVKDTDIANTLNLVELNQLRMYAHAPYIFNLCDTEDYIARGLSEHLQLATSCGFKGMVVHVGKRVKRDMDEALENMKQNILRVLEAVPQGIFILETPAGQGSEVLTTCDEFMDWVCSLNHPRLKVCIDTCHVFATGIQPSEYLTAVLAKKKWKDTFTLLHFNDSQEDLGSRVDRHAVIGGGKIGREELIKCARMVDVDIIAEW
jgi:endonuclease IV